MRCFLLRWLFGLIALNQLHALVAAPQGFRKVKPMSICVLSRRRAGVAVPARLQPEIDTLGKSGFETISQRSLVPLPPVGWLPL